MAKSNYIFDASVSNSAKKIDALDLLSRENDILKSRLQATETDLLIKLHNSSFDPVVISDLSGYIIRSNKRFIQFFGYEQIDSVNGENVFDLISLGAREYFEEIIDHEVHFNGCWRGILSARDQSGHEVDVEITISKTLNNLLVIVIRPLQEIYFKQDKEPDKSIYQEVLDNLPAQVIVKDEYGNVIYKNKSFEEFHGKKPAAELQNIYSDDFNKSLNSSLPVITNKESAVSRTGRRSWLSSSIISVDVGPGKLFIKTANDISESVKSFDDLSDQNWLFEQITDTVSDGIIMTDSKDRVVYSNNAFSKLFSINCRDISGFYIEHLSDRIAMPDLSKAYNDVLENNNRIRFESLVKIGKTNKFLQCTIIPMIKNEQLKATLCLFTDITEEKLARDIISDSEKYFYELYQNATIGLYRTSPDGKILMANKAFMDIHGLDPDIDTSKRNLDVVAMRAKYPREEFMRQMKEKGKISGFEVEMYKPDGTKLYIRENAKAYKDNAGNILYYEGAVEDITEMKMAIEALGRSQERYKMIVELSPEGIVTIDKEACITSVNNVFARSLRLAKQQIIGQKIYELDNFDDHQKKQYYWLFQKLTGYGISNPYEITYTDFRGRTAFGHIFVGELYEESKLTGYQLLIRDISMEQLARVELEKSEQKFRSFIKYSRDGIIVMDSVGQVLAWNKAMTKISGVPSDYVLGKRLWDISFNRGDDEIADFLSNMKSEVSSLLVSKSDEFRTPPFEVPFYHTESETIYGSIQVFKCKVQDGFIIGCIIRDITEQRNADEALKQFQLDLQKTNLEKDKLLTIIGHDLRSPISGFVGLTEILRDSIERMTSQEVRDITGVLADSATGIMDLLSNLLDWSMIRRGIAKFHPDEYKIEDLILVCSNLLMPMAKAKDIELVCDMCHSDCLYTDKDMFSSLIRNLVINAIKFSPRGSSVVVTSQCDKPGLMTVEVKDHGVGIAPEMLPTIFHIEENKSKSGTNGEKGTGLGLPVCKEIVELHGGDLLVESQPGNGTVFKFTIPSNYEMYSKLRNPIYNLEQ